MSYRTFKRLLGETSLERKCRLLFGGGLLVLISVSFYIYSHQTQKIISEQNLEVARTLVPNAILAKHADYIGNKEDQSQKFAQMLEALKPTTLEDQSWALLKTDSRDLASRPIDQIDTQAIYKLMPSGPGKKDATDKAKVRPLEWPMARKVPTEEFRYYAQLPATELCIDCHQKLNSLYAESAPSGSAAKEVKPIEVGNILGVVKITYPLKKFNQDVSRNNAFLLATAIITAALAWFGTYGIVRYVIVKPVLHLKEVSDSITRGDLDQRADIRTGDEFEELSQAFNRMLRHLTAVQEDLQKANRGFERKVDELAQANLRLFELNNLKNEFLATMSHELRTPLNSILGFSDVLLTNPANLTDKQQRYVAHIQTSGRTLMSLITDVLDLAKIESGKMELRPVELSVSDLVERVVGAMMPLAERKSIDLNWEVDPDVPVAFQDLGKLQQILNNLLSNAIKFTPEGGRVRVKVSKRHDNLLFVVEDTGIGIPLEDQERIFEKFRQGTSNSGEDNTLTREFEGTGLGLSITRELSKLLGGGIGLQSEFGKGSRFTVVVPIRITLPAEADPTRPRPVSEAIDLMLERPTGSARRGAKQNDESPKIPLSDSV